MPLVKAHEDIEDISNYRAVNQRSRRRQKEVEQADQTVPVVNRQIQQKCYIPILMQVFLSMFMFGFLRDHSLSPKFMLA